MPCCDGCRGCCGKCWSKIKECAGEFVEFLGGLLANFTRIDRMKIPRGLQFIKAFVSAGILVYIIIVMFDPKFNVAKSAYQIDIGSDETNIQVTGSSSDLTNPDIVYDAAELSDIDEDSVIITVDFSEEVQNRGTCDEAPPLAPCKSDEDCAAFKNTAARSGHGIFNGLCNTTTSNCLLKGWCPVHRPRIIDHVQPRLNMKHIKDFIIRIDNYVTFPKFNARVYNGDEKGHEVQCLDADEKRGPRGELTQACTTFRLGAILDKITETPFNLTANLRNGITIGVEMEWECDFIPFVADFSTSNRHINFVHCLLRKGRDCATERKVSCSLKYAFTQLDISKTSANKHGFKTVDTTYHLDSDNKARTLYTNYAVNLVIKVQATAKRIRVSSIVASFAGMFSLFGATVLVSRIFVTAPDYQAVPQMRYRKCVNKKLDWANKKLDWANQKLDPIKAKINSCTPCITRKTNCCCCGCVCEDYQQILNANESDIESEDWMWA